MADNKQEQQQQQQPPPSSRSSATPPALSYSTDPTLYLYTSLTAGSSHIITATSRLETILKANKIPFRAIDVATDEKARMLWGRRSKGRRLPGLVRYGMIIGDLEQIEEWNEHGELKMQLENTQLPQAPQSQQQEKTTTTTITTTSLPSTTTASSSAASATQAQPIAAPRPSLTPHIQIADTPSRTSSAASGEERRYAATLRQASEEAAAKAKDSTRTKLGLGAGKKSGLGVGSSSQTQAEQAVAQTAVEAQKKAEREEEGEEKEKKKDEEADQVLKDAQRRASGAARAERPELEDTALESSADVRAVKMKDAEEEAKPKGRSGEVSATLATEKEEVAKELNESAGR